MSKINPPNPTPKELAQSFIEDVWNNEDSARLSELAAPEDTTTASPLLKYQWEKGLNELCSSYRAKFPDYHLTIQEQIAEADRVVNVLVSQSKGNGSQTTNGKTLQDLTLVVQVEGSHIVAGQLYPDVGELVAMEVKAQPAYVQGLVSMQKRPAVRYLECIILGALVVWTLWHFYDYLTWYSADLANKWLLADTVQLEVLPRVGVPADMSDDGTLGVFVSKSDMSGKGIDQNKNYDVYVHDFKMNTNIRVSKSYTDTDGNNWSSQATISADGHYVYFVSAASNLVISDTNGNNDFFVYDLLACKTYSYTADSAISAQLAGFATDIWWAPTTTWQRHRLLEQYDSVRALGLRHLRIVTYFYQHYFASTGVGILTAILATLCLTWISRLGWNKANPYVVTLFVVFTATSLLLLSLRNVYSYEENIDANKKAYLAYVSLQNQILSYIGTSHQIDDGSMPGKPYPVNDFLLAVDKQIRTLNTFPIEIKASDINKPTDLLSDYAQPSSRSEEC